PSDKPTTLRERELLALLGAADTKPDGAIKASIELGLLYVHERRLTEANERFDKLRQKSADWNPAAARTAALVGRFGQAVVLAHEDKAKASNDLFLEAARDLPKGPILPKADRPPASVNWTLLRYPDLSHAVSDALTRNAANLGQSKLEPPALEQLRAPARVGKKE
ncbi:MAG: hypothetical protein K2V38_23380, partial [Gemmataceae bacterium]|nr:hypothetical protein [Gemmataceae bacterium]